MQPEILPCHARCNRALSCCVSAIGLLSKKVMNIEPVVMKILKHLQRYFGYHPRP
jgi:hypothetical protein